MSSVRPTSVPWRAVVAAATSALMVAALALVGIAPAQATGGLFISGMVVNESGDPVAGVTVGFGDGTITPDVTTDLDGAYVSGELPEGTYTVVVNDSTLAYWSATQPGVTVTAGEENVADDITLQPRPNYVLRGQVTNEATGDPVPNMTVTAWDLLTPSFQGRSAITDADGFYEITHIPRTNVSLSTADSDDTFKFWRLDNVAVGAEPTTFDIALESKPTGIGAVAGVIRDRNTLTPIPNAQVQAQGPNGYNANAISDADGAYAFTGVPLGTVTIHASSPFSWPDPPVYLSSSASMILTAAAPSRERDLLLKVAPTGVSVVSGTITEADGNGGSSPLADFWVSANASDMSSAGNAVKTDATGSFSIGSLAKGVYALSVSPVDFSQADAFRPLDYRDRLVTVDGENAVTKNVELVRYPTGTGSVSGVLTDRRTDSPIAGANVGIRTTDGSLSKTVYTNTLGQWSIPNLPDGEYGLGISSFEHEYQWTWPRFTIVDGGHVDLVNTLTSVAPGTASLSGRVKNSVTHEGVAGATIEVDRTEGGFDRQSAVTNAQGDFVVPGLPAGQYRVTIGAENFASSVSAVDIAESEVAPLNPRLVPTDPVPTGEGTVTGTVTDANGDPVQGVRVSASADSGQPVGAMGWASTTTDAEGHYELGSLAIMKMNISVSAPGFASAWRLITLSADTPEVHQDFEIEEDAAISGIVSTTGGLPAAALQAMAFTTDGVPMWGGIVNESTGAYTIDGLPAGDYIIRLLQSDELIPPVEPGGSATPSIAGAYWKLGSSTGTQDPASATVIHVGAGDHSLGHDIELAEGGTITGTVRVATADGTTALPQGKTVKVIAYKKEAGSWVPQEFAYTYAHQGSDGGYTLLGLTPGQYTLEFSDTWNGNRAYTTTFNGGAAVPGDAPTITVSAGGTTAGIDAAMSAPVPSTESSAVATANLAASTEGQVGAPGNASNGEEITVNVGSELAGEFVSVWAHSTPTPLTGWVKVASDGTVKATVASTLPAGQHHLVVQDADDAVVGWSEISVKEGTAAGSGSGSTGGSGSSSGTSTGQTGGSTRSASPGEQGAGEALEAIAETFDESSADDADVAKGAARDHEAAAEDSATEAISTEGGGPNWTLLLGLLVGVVAIGAVGGIVATVRARRE